MGSILYNNVKNVNYIIVKLMLIFCIDGIEFVVMKKWGKMFEKKLLYKEEVYLVYWYN